MSIRAPPMPPANETENSISRVTRDGKKLTYKLSIMQQPERARACGAGAKSSADRRPVDPPPVVELRVFESDPNDDMHKTDITFAYNASFFLYATLENARPIAHGKAVPPAACPVLTGVPVAGVAYLDRPAQAGYFIFPDLSVRHEGRYRLTFHLYEEIKDAKDLDRDPALSNQKPLPSSASGKSQGPQTYFHFRLEVKSVPFTVYSAKKFPGSATSTSLSRIIAEQGCRVRIRRDVRMRRRNEKQGDEYEFDEDRVFSRTSRYTTPDGFVAPPVERPRSTGNSIVEPSYPYFVDSQRRASLTDYGYPVAQNHQQRPVPPVSSPSSSNTSSYQSHLTFGSSQSSYMTPQRSSTSHPTGPPVSYSPQLSNIHARKSSTASEYETTVVYPYPQSCEYSKAPLPPLRLEPPNKTPPVMQPYGEHCSSDTNMYKTAHPPIPASAVPSLPPLKVLSGEMPTLNNPQTPAPTSGQKFYYDTRVSLSKRSHEESFGHEERPLCNGMHPDSEIYPPGPRKPMELNRDFYPKRRGEMEYKRANGRMASKISPAVQ